MKHVAVLAVLLAVYSVFLPPFLARREHTPAPEKLGVTLPPRILQVLADEHSLVLGAKRIFDGIIHYGECLIQREQGALPDFQGLYQAMNDVSVLDPYNMDGYYFAQSVLVWDLKRTDLANNLLRHGMKYRSWDPQLPFFAGFNSAYFDKDYEAAMGFYKRAAELNDSPLMMKLASRYMYEAGRTALGIAYLKAMIPGARNESVKQSLSKRLNGLEALQMIETAASSYIAAEGVAPKSLNQLLTEGYLEKLPQDPYGGEYSIDNEGRVRVSSDLADGHRARLERDADRKE